MKNLISIIVLMLSILMTPYAFAFPISAPLFFALGYIARENKDKPIPYNLTDACQEKTIKSLDGKYSYISYEHCIGK